MRIAYDYQIFHSQRYGGISRYFSRLAEQLHGLGKEVRVVAPVHRNHHLSSLPQSLVAGWRLDRYPRGAARVFGFVNRSASKVMLRRWSPSLVHETYYSDVDLGPKRAARVVTVYDMIYELFPGDFPARDVTSRMKRAAVDRADHVICISENTRADLIELFGVPAEKTTVVHLGYERLPTHRGQEAPQVERRPFLLYVGGRRGYKNFVRFLEAVSGSQTLKSGFDIVAFGGGPFSAAEQELVEHLGLGSGAVRQVSGDDRALGTLYEGATALVYPSRYEGFGMPLLEAMAHGCPVVASRASSVPEVAGDAAEFFAPDCVEDMRGAIERVALSHERRQALVQRGNLRLSGFSWASCAAQTLAVYRRTLENQSAGRSRNLVEVTGQT
jgi:glycosyltransferase involved in cell wall biosynthesis